MGDWRSKKKRKCDKGGKGREGNQKKRRIGRQNKRRVAIGNKHSRIRGEPGKIRERD